MYITKIFLPAMLALSGLSLAAVAKDAGAVEAQAADSNTLAASEGTAFAFEQDLHPADIDDIATGAEELDARDEADSAEDEQGRRRRCRRREYWDDSRRRCRRCRRYERNRCYRY